MMETRVPAEAEAAASLLRWVRRLLPVYDLSELLAGLAESWLEPAAAEAVVACSASAAGDRLVAASATFERAPVLFETFWQPWSQWDTEDVLSALHESPPVCAAERANWRVVPLTLAGRGVGALVLPCDGPAAEPSLPAELLDLSARLIVQAAALEVQRLPKSALERAKLEALAEFAAGAGHEINNPVATIAGRAQMLLAGETDPQRRQALATIGGQAYRIRDMIGDAMLFARPPRPRCERVDLGRIAAEVAASLQEAADAADCRLELRDTEPAGVWADPTQVAVVVESLIRNAINAAGQGGAIEVCTRRTDEGGGELTVADDGPGLSAVDRQHLFDPFYSGRQAGRGLGFGLSKCWRIVSNHGGRIDVRSIRGRSTVFAAYWPAAPAA